MNLFSHKKSFDKALHFQTACEALQKENDSLKEEINYLQSRIASLENARAAQWNNLLNYSGKAQRNLQEAEQ